MLVFDITSFKSFENLSIWKSEFLLKAMPQNPDQIPFFVLGNKVDKPQNEHQVPGDTVEAYLR